MTSHFDCDCPECQMEMIPQPKEGFGSEALNELRVDLYHPDAEIRAFCKGCYEAGDCVYCGDESARVMCRLVQRAERRQQEKP